jgi:hypothetical protein
MAWTFPNNWTDGSILGGADLNKIRYDQEHWGGNVDGGGYSLLNVTGLSVGSPSSPINSPVAGRGYFTIKGSSDAGVLELATGSADADATMMGQIVWTDPVNTQTDKRIAAIQVFRSGSVAGNRGSYMQLFTRADGATAMAERIRITNTGAMGIGLTPIGVAPLQVHCATNQNFWLGTASGVTTIQILNDAYSTNVPLQMQASSFAFMNGNVSIGTMTASASLTLNSAAAPYSDAWGQFCITDSANTNRRLRFGYDASLDSGWIQAALTGTGVKPLLLNPNGGGPVVVSNSASTGVANTKFEVVNGRSIFSAGGEPYVVGLRYFQTNTVVWIGADSSGSFTICDAGGSTRFLFGQSGSFAATTLPSANPGAGSKQFWYDPADGNRVKYAP